MRERRLMLSISPFERRRAMKELAGIDQAIDELLVQLGGLVLRLASPEVTKRPDERRALARSVNQYSVCAARSDNPRVQELKLELRATIKPRLRLVVSK
jgi:hypothetical protein